MNKNIKALYDLTGRVTVITGGAGMLGEIYAEAIAEAGGIPVLADINGDSAAAKALKIKEKYGVDAMGLKTDITKKADVSKMTAAVLKKYGRIDSLINNAANDPKVETGDDNSWTRFENFPADLWEKDLAVGITGAFLCSQVIGSEMAKRGGGVIVNIGSDLAVIGPDQRLYRKKGLPEDRQPAKPVSYSVVKTALLGLTRYLATYWADKGVRVNAFCPGGVKTSQPDDFLKELNFRIPLGRMAQKDEYKGVILFLLSDASSYMTGANLIVDGGRTAW